MDRMIIRPAYIMGKHRYSFRCNEAAEVIGVYYVTPLQSEIALFCYKLRYSDGTIDYIPLSSVENGDYTFVISKTNKN